jgi:hypothetical protein
MQLVELIFGCFLVHFYSDFFFDSDFFLASSAAFASAAILSSLCQVSVLLKTIVFYLFLAVLAARLKFAAVGAPLAPGFLIFSPEPFLILRRLA